MSYAIPRKNLSNEMARQIESDLKIIPKAKSINDKSNKIPIPFYNYKNGVIHLPCAYASRLLDIEPNVDLEFKKIDIEYKGTLFSHQVPVEKEIFEQLQNYGYSTLGVYPGFGKTEVALLEICKLKLFTLIIVPRIPLTKQWKFTVERSSNAKVEIFNSKKTVGDCDILIVNIDSCKKIPQEILDKVGFLILDEAHMLCTRSRFESILDIHPKYILAETATLDRKDRLDDMIRFMCGTQGVFLKPFKKHTVKKIETYFEPDFRLNSQGTPDYSYMESSIVNNEDRNLFILSLLLDNPVKTLILGQRTEHIIHLCELITQLGISCDYLCGSKNSYNDSRVLVGTWQKIGTGFDEQTMCENYGGERLTRLIFITSIKQEAQLTQNVGRVFRSDSPQVVVLVDDHNIYKKHWTAARKWYTNSGGHITVETLEKAEFLEIKKVVLQKLEEGKLLGNAKKINFEDEDDGKKEVDEEENDDEEDEEKDLVVKKTKVVKEAKPKVVKEVKPKVVKEAKPKVVKEAKPKVVKDVKPKVVKEVKPKVVKEVKPKVLKQTKLRSINIEAKDFKVTTIKSIK